MKLYGMKKVQVIIMRLNKIISGIMIVAVCVGLFSGCVNKTENDLSQTEIRNIAEIATLEAYYHNVARLHHDKSGKLFGIGNIGYKQMWFEYTGLVRIGVDAKEITVSEPSANGVVKIKLPEAGILGSPDILEKTVSDPIIDKGWFTKITAEEKKTSLVKAQEQMLKEAEKDDTLKAQAYDRVKVLLEQYVKNAGEAVDKKYTVEWIEE